MSKRQNSLIESWSKGKAKKKRSIEEVECIVYLSSGSDDDFQRDIRESDESDYSDLEAEESSERATVAIQGVPTIEDHSECHDLVPVDADEVCQSSCCSNIKEPYQPKNTKILHCLARCKRSFMSNWYKTYPWLSVCITKKKVFCFYCRYAQKQMLLNFSKRGEDTFTKTGYNNWKKALEKFKNHSLSITHCEAVMKWQQLQQPSISSRLNAQTDKLLASRRNALLWQLKAIRLLLHQGLSLRGHDDTCGNLHQLLVMVSGDCADVKSWIYDKRYMSHEIVNEQICIMANTLLRLLLTNISANTPSWYSVIGDEATDVAKREQFNLSIRWVDGNYHISEDPVGLYCLPNTAADTLCKVIKDILIRCSLPLSLCRGQAYDGAANMQGIRNGVATRIQRENPAALPVHCLAHSLNLCLQDTGRQILLLRDALDVVKEITQLIKFSPKRSHLFSEKLKQCDSESKGVNIKLLCITRWTARHGALEAILADYSILMETMEDINVTSRDEYGVKAGGILSLMEKFSTLFGIELGYLVFGAAESLSNTLQGKDTSFQEAIAAVNLAKSFYKRLRKEEEFNRFYDKVVKKAQDVKISSPSLPRYRKAPRRVDDGSNPHQFATPRDYFRRQYYQTCDLLLGELDERFEQSKVIPSVLAIEKLLISAANGKTYDEHLKTIRESCYKEDFNFSELQKQLPLLVDVIKHAIPLVKTVTSIRTICEAMNTQTVYKQCSLKYITCCGST